MSLLQVVTTYDGVVYLNFTSNREVMPDIVFYGDCVMASHEELLKAVS